MPPLPQSDVLNQCLSIAHLRKDELHASCRTDFLSDTKLSHLWHWFVPIFLGLAMGPPSLFLRTLDARCSWTGTMTGSHAAWLIKRTLGLELKIISRQKWRNGCFLSTALKFFGKQSDSVRPLSFSVPGMSVVQSNISGILKHREEKEGKLPKNKSLQNLGPSQLLAEPKVSHYILSLKSFKISWSLVDLDPRSVLN